MAITTVGAATAEQTNFTLSAPLDADPGDLFRLDDEVVSFGGYYRVDRQHAIDRKHIAFHRGEAGTTAATHANGTTLRGIADALASSADETPADPFSVGGVQTVRLLGPYTVDNSEMILGEIDVEGLIIGEAIAAGSTILRATIFVTAFLETTPSHNNPTVLDLSISESGTVSPRVVIAKYDPNDQTESPSFANVESGYHTSYPKSPTTAYAKTDLDLRLFVDTAGEDIGFGSVQIVALIAEPA